MKHFLIFFVMNMTDASDPSIMLHAQYKTEQACKEAAAELPKPPENLRTAAFCISEDDLLHLRRT